jgi:hypothetical protein
MLTILEPRRARKKAEFKVDSEASEERAAQDVGSGTHRGTEQIYGGGQRETPHLQSTDCEPSKQSRRPGNHGQELQLEENKKIYTKFLSVAKKKSKEKQKGDKNFRAWSQGRDDVRI